LVELESAYKAAVVGSSEYIKQGRNKLTRLVQEYDAGKTKYSLQKEDNLIKQKYTGCHRRKGPNFGRVFLMLNYTDITQNTYIQS